MTELITGLGMLGGSDVASELDREPREMASVSPERWEELRAVHDGGLLRSEFLAAFSNGQAFLAAGDALRGRPPRLVEWKGATKATGDEVVPADLRIDHVYLVSCKYLSGIVLNTSPAHVFDRSLSGGHGIQGPDWYREVAPEELDRLYRATIEHLHLNLPAERETLSREQRKQLATALRGGWPVDLRTSASELSAAVSERSASRWRAVLGASTGRERVLWRLLRIGSAPYFMLGADGSNTLRLRVETPWDWAQKYQVTDFRVSSRESLQPVVDWTAAVRSRLSGLTSEIVGHIEIRWAHGKFNGPPEAKAYLDTPHHRVPGYIPLV